MITQNNVFCRKETEVILDLTKVLTQQIIAASNLTSAGQAAMDIEAVLSEHITPDSSQQGTLITAHLTYIASITAQLICIT